jgi:hypothetical protein
MEEFFSFFSTFLLPKYDGSSNNGLGALSKQENKTRLGRVEQKKEIYEKFSISTSSLSSSCFHKNIQNGQLLFFFAHRLKCPT